MAETENKSGALAIAATLVKGVNLLQPLQVCLLGSSYAMKRFGYGQEAVGVFVGFCHNAMEFFFLIAALSTFGALEGLKSKDKKYPVYLSISSSWAVVIINYFLLRAFANGEGNENITYYYWMLVLAYFVAGIEDMSTSSVASDTMSSYGLGISLTGIVVALFHWAVIAILRKCDMDINYYLLLYQLRAVFFLSLGAACLWTYYAYKEKLSGSGTDGENTSSGASSDGLSDAYVRTLPMTAMSSIVWALIFVIYPLIAPFEMVGVEHQCSIQRACLVAHTLSGVGLFCLDKFAKLGEEWKDDKQYYHFMWLFMVPFLGIAVCFIYAMHHPTSTLARKIYMKPKVVGSLSVLFFFSGRTVVGVSCVSIAGNANKKNGSDSGSSGTGSSSTGSSDTNHGSTISMMNLAINLIVLILMKYGSEAYIQHFRAARKASEAGVLWPTEGMSGCRAFGYWLKVGCVEGAKGIKKLAVTDVRSRL